MGYGEEAILEGGGGEASRVEGRGLGDALEAPGLERGTDAVLGEVPLDEAEEKLELVPGQVAVRVVVEELPPFWREDRHCEDGGREKRTTNVGLGAILRQAHDLMDLGEETEALLLVEDVARLLGELEEELSQALGLVCLLVLNAQENLRLVDRLGGGVSERGG